MFVTVYRNSINFEFVSVNSNGGKIHNMEISINGIKIGIIPILGHFRKISVKIYYMNFWERVDTLLVDKNITRKALARDAGFDVSNIGKGISNNNIPAADTAVKIAKILDTSVEYLVTGVISSPDLPKQNLDNLYRYSKIIRALDSIPEESRSSVELFINDLSSKYHSSKK